MEVKEWKSNTIPIEELSQLFTEFYKGSPWNEFLQCPNCKKTNDFGPDYSFGYEEDKEKQIEFCPKCKTQLELFWSNERIFYYLFELNNMGEVLFIDGKIAAWWKGRTIEKNILYIDIIAIMPEFRKNQNRKMIIEYFQKEIKKYHLTHKILARTHKKAIQVRSFLRFFGFTEKESTADDPNHSYWIID